MLGTRVDAAEASISAAEVPSAVTTSEDPAMPRCAKSYSISALRKRVIAAGVQDDVLEAADDSDSPKEALIELIVASAAAAAAESGSRRYSCMADVDERIAKATMILLHAWIPAAALDSKVASVESKLSSRIDGCVTEAFASRQSSAAEAQDLVSAQMSEWRRNHRSAV